MSELAVSNGIVARLAGGSDHTSFAKLLVLSMLGNDTNMELVNSLTDLFKSGLVYPSQPAHRCRQPRGRQAQHGPGAPCANRAGLHSGLSKERGRFALLSQKRTFMPFATNAEPALTTETAPSVAHSVPPREQLLLLAGGLTTLLSLAACGGGSMGDTVPQQLSAGAVRTQPDLLPRPVVSREKAQAARTPTASEVFDWAQRQFPAIFSSNEANISAAGGLVYRFYPGTGHYLAVLDGNVLVLGPLTQGNVVNVGPLQSFADAVGLSTNTAAKPNTDAEAARFLLHAQFSASEAEISALKARGYAAWLDEQLALPNSQSGWDWLVSKGYSAVDTNEYFFNVNISQYMVWYQLMQAPDTVRQRWTWALSEVFVIAARGISMLEWPGFAVTAYWDVLTKHALGTYRDLLEAVTLNPAMGVFLSTLGNLKEEPATGRLPDENYAREVMQLFSIGLHELNLDGSVKRDAKGQPIESYTSDDVSHLARVFTGYKKQTTLPIATSPKPPFNKVGSMENARGSMRFDPSSHSLLEKRFLGVNIPANTQGPESLRIALDALANHPNTAPFLCRQFIQRMVTSNPSPAYVQRVAQVFNNNGNGVRGDLKAVLKAIVLDEEAVSATSLTNATFGKLRCPVIRVAQWARTFKARSTQGTWKMALWDGNPSQDANQYPLNPPSVFSYYRPGYVPPGTAMATAGATAPEFQIVNESSVAGWVNLLQSFVHKGFWVSAPNLPQHGNNATDGHDIVPDYSAEKALAADPQALVNRLNLLLCAGQLSPATVQLIVTALQADRIQANSTDDLKQIHVARALMFVMCAAEYIAQR